MCIELFIIILKIKAKSFKLDRTSTEDEHREGCPFGSLAEDNVKKILDIGIGKSKSDLIWQCPKNLWKYIAYEKGIFALSTKNIIDYTVSSSGMKAIYSGLSQCESNRLL